MPLANSAQTHVYNALQIILTAFHALLQSFWKTIFVSLIAVLAIISTNTYYNAFSANLLVYNVKVLPIAKVVKTLRKFYIMVSVLTNVLRELILQTSNACHAQHNASCVHIPIQQMVHSVINAHQIYLWTQLRTASVKCLANSMNMVTFRQENAIHVKCLVMSATLLQNANHAFPGTLSIEVSVLKVLHVWLVLIWIHFSPNA